MLLFLLLWFLCWARNCTGLVTFERNMYTEHYILLPFQRLVLLVGWLIGWNVVGGSWWLLVAPGGSWWLLGAPGVPGVSL